MTSYLLSKEIMDNNLPSNILLSLPEETLRDELFKHLNVEDIVNLIFTCSYFQKLAANNWRLIAHLKYPSIKNMEQKIGGEYELNYEVLAKRLFALTKHKEIIKEDVNACYKEKMDFLELFARRHYSDIFVEILKRDNEKNNITLEKFDSSDTPRDFLNSHRHLYKKEKEIIKYLDFIYCSAKQTAALAEQTDASAELRYCNDEQEKTTENSLLSRKRTDMEMGEWRLRHTSNSLNQDLYNFKTADFIGILHVFIKHDDMQTVELILDYLNSIECQFGAEYENIKSVEMERILISKGLVNTDFYLYKEFFISIIKRGNLDNFTLFLEKKLNTEIYNSLFFNVFKYGSLELLELFLEKTNLKYLDNYSLSLTLKLEMTKEKKLIFKTIRCNYKNINR